MLRVHMRWLVFSSGGGYRERGRRRGSREVEAETGTGTGTERQRQAGTEADTHTHTHTHTDGGWERRTHTCTHMHKCPRTHATGYNHQTGSSLHARITITSIASTRAWHACLLVQLQVRSNSKASLGSVNLAWQGR